MNDLILDYDHALVLWRLLAAMVAGGLIGMERALHGREAGFRTHMLVCVSSSLLMVLVVYQWQLVPQQYLDTVRADPARMAQGIMTGIGFLGAGVIIKEGLTVRGLTTAASIWITASIGIVIGLGFYFPAVIATIITLVTLSAMRWIEARLPSQRYGRLTVRFVLRQKNLDEDGLRAIISASNVRSFDASYRLCQEGRQFEYEMTIRSRRQEHFRQLAQKLMEREDVLEFHIIPA